MEKKNEDARFKKAFEDVPEHVWRVFTEPNELIDHVQHIAGQAHQGLTGALQA